MIWLSVFAKASDLPKEEYIIVIDNDFTQSSLTQRYLWASREDTVDLKRAVEDPSIFELLDQRRLHLGNFNDYGWIKINLANHSTNDQFVLEFDETYLDSLKTYLVRHDTVIREFAPLGLQFPDHWEREYLSVNPSYSYALRIPQGDTLSVYMHCSIQKGTLQASQTLWTPISYENRKKEVRFETTYLFLLIGFSLLVILVALVFFTFTRDTIHLYYIGFIIANIGNIVLMADFFSPRRFEQFFTLGLNYTDAFGLAQVFFGLQYVIHFLQLKHKAPLMYRFMRIVVWSVLVNTLLMLFLKQFFWIEVFTFNLLTFKLLFSMISCIGVSAYLSWKRDLMARYFLVAYLPLLYFTAHYFAFILELTDVERTLSWEAVIFFEIFVLTVAMAHRYYLIGKKNIEYQKTINNQQKDQIKHIISAQEKERGKIARELHDGVVQELGSVILGLRHLGNNGENKDTLLETLENSSRDLRTLSHSMMPKTLKELGIVSAARQTIRAALEYTEIKHSFETFNFENRPSEIIEITLYRILQELINNLVKHSRANSVSVQLFTIEKDILMVFSDDGVGMGEISSEEGMGLRNIRSRLEMVDGSVSIEPNEPSGTTFSIRIPYVEIEQNMTA